MTDLKRIADEMGQHVYANINTINRWKDALDALAAQSQPAAWRGVPAYYFEAISLALERANEFALRNVSAFGAHSVLSTSHDATGFLLAMKDGLTRTDPSPLFDPARLLPPDAEGFFCHPDLYAIFGDDECDQDESIRRLRLRGWEADYVSGDELVNPDTLEYNVRGWTPEAPHGDGWRLVCVFDSEDGPYALFVRPMSQPVAPEEFQDALSVYGAERYADGQHYCGYNQSTEKARAEVLRLYALASAAPQPTAPQSEPATMIETIPVDETHELRKIDGFWQLFAVREGTWVRSLNGYECEFVDCAIRSAALQTAARLAAPQRMTVSREALCKALHIHREVGRSLTFTTDVIEAALRALGIDITE